VEKDCHGSPSQLSCWHGETGGCTPLKCHEVDWARRRGGMRVLSSKNEALPS